MDYGKIKVVPFLPNGWNPPSQGAEICREIAGSTIVAFGAVSGADVEGGGLVIDYKRPETERVYRVVLEFNDFGMWTPPEGGDANWPILVASPTKG